MDSRKRLYACGIFTRSGTKVLNRIAIWGGTSWNPVIHGGLNDCAVNGFNGACRKIAIDSNDSLYAIGDFTSVVLNQYNSTLTANRIAKWNKFQWSALRTGANNSINYINFYFNHIIVGGTFTNVDGITANGIAKWNGYKWNNFNTTFNIVSPLQSMAFSKNDMKTFYIGGSFTRINDTSYNRMANCTFRSVNLSYNNQPVDTLDFNGDAAIVYTYKNGIKSAAVSLIINNVVNNY
jgi:hypothetical protein